MNVSVFVMYSIDRKSQFEIALECWREIEGFEECQKILLVDQLESNIYPEGFEVYTIQRPKQNFNWSAMWNAGVERSTSEICWYLDSDRIIPKDYLKKAKEKIDDGKFVFTTNLFQLRNPMAIEQIRNFRNNVTAEEIKLNYGKYLDLLFFDPRFTLPLTSSGKNPMSGNVLFTKKTYLDSGGVDSFYEGHGAFADTDFHTQCYKLGYLFEDVRDLELHLCHEKIEGKSLSFRELGILGLNNMVRYLRKWRMPLTQAVDAARFLHIYDPEGFITSIELAIGTNKFPVMEGKRFV